jgi:hypothetical protein
MRCVVSLTSIPSRVGDIAPTINSLLQQDRKPDNIYVWLPQAYSRAKGSVGVLPEVLQRVDVRQCVDHGPFTKLRPALEAETAPDTLIVTADDDRLYLKSWLAKLVRFAKRFPAAALGYRGRTLQPGSLRYRDSTLVTRQSGAPVPVDIITGTSGAAYRRGLFDDTIFENVRHPPAFYNDDLWVCGNLAQRGVPRLVIPGPAERNRNRIARTESLWAMNKDGAHNDALLELFSTAFR